MRISEHKWIGRRLLLLALAAVPALGAAAGELFPPAQLTRIREGVRDIYNLDHARAAANFERMIAESPEDAAGYAYLAMTLWRRELSLKEELSIDRFASSDFFSDKSRPIVDADPTLESRFRQLSDDAILRARRGLGRGSQAKTSLFLLELTYLNLASFEASLKRNWWAAFRNGSRSYGYNRDLLRLDSQFHDARLATGVCDYAAGSLGWSVKWLALLMGYPGNRTRGIQDIETAARRGQLAADDARVMLVLIYTRERQYQRAHDCLAELLANYPRNYLLHLDMAGTALLMKQPSRAIPIYEQILRLHEQKVPNYQKLERAALYNRLGVAFRANGDLPASAAWFRRAIAENGISARSAALAHLELGKTLEAMGRRGEAVTEYQKAASAPDFAGTRREAQKLLRTRLQ